MTYNVHSCRGTDGRLCHERIADVIERFDPDIVALQELDSKRARSGGLDQTRAIGEILEMDSHFHAALRTADEEYGDAILSRHPLRLVQAQALPTPPSLFLKEQRGAIWVSVSIEGCELQVINSHFGLARGERRQQARALLGEGWLGAARAAGPVVVCGDFNSPAGGGVHGMFREALADAQLAVPIVGTRRTFATTFPFVCLDYVFVSPDLQVKAVEIPRTPLTRAASEHFPLIVDLEFKPVVAAVPA
jgi:endonuclease/exonuclease/phosphatase family metal-dependent hydrolase